MTVPAGPEVEPADTDELPILPAPDSSVRGIRGFAFAHPIGLLVAALVGGALAYCFDDSSRLAVTAIAVVQGVLVVTWVFGIGLPGRAGAIVLGAAAAASADIVVTHGHNELGSLVAVLGLSVIGLFGHQLLRAKRRARVVESLSRIALLLVAIVALSSLLELRHQVDGPALATAVLLAVTAAQVTGHLIDWAWSPLRFDPAISRGLLAVAGSVIAGAVVGVARLQHSADFTGQRAALLGGALGLVAAVFAIGAAFITHEAAVSADSATPADSAAPDPAVPTDSRRRDRLMRVLGLGSGTVFTFALTSPLGYLLTLALRN